MTSLWQWIFTIPVESSIPTWFIIEIILSWHETSLPHFPPRLLFSPGPQFPCPTGTPHTALPFKYLPHPVLKPPFSDRVCVAVYPASNYAQCVYATVFAMLHICRQLRAHMQWCKLHADGWQPPFFCAVQAHVAVENKRFSMIILSI